MDIQKRLQQLEVIRNQATQEAIMQENVLQGARQKVAEIQGRINELQLIQKQKDGKKNVRPKAKAD